MGGVSSIQFYFGFFELFVYFTKPLTEPQKRQVAL